jgi:hypothetical protein
LTTQIRWSEVDEVKCAARSKTVKTIRNQILLAVVLVGALVATVAHAQTAAQKKATPASVEQSAVVHNMESGRTRSNPGADHMERGRT